MRDKLVMLVQDVALVLFVLWAFAHIDYLR